MPPPTRTAHTRNRPTQKDIAKVLGISQATVAMALNPRTQGKLMPTTVAQVQAKAKEMNYSPQRQASILRSGRSYTIGVIFISGYHAPQQHIKYLAQTAILSGYQLVAVDIEWFGRDVEQAAEYLKGAAAEGIVLCNFSSEIMQEWFKVRHHWPVISMGMSFSEGDNAYSDMEDAYYRMTLHHLEQGSRKLTLLLSFYDSLVLNLTPVSPMIQSRVDGFKRAIIEAGGKVFTTEETPSRLLGLPLGRASTTRAISGQVVYSLRNSNFNNAFELGAWYVQHLLDKKKPLPDSLVCSNDEIAAGVLKSCLQRQIDVPDMIRVSGADDAPFARFCGIPITTIVQPSKEIAHFCIQRVVKMIEQPEENKKPQQKLFSCELVYRNSTIGPAIVKTGKQQARSPQNRRA